MKVAIMISGMNRAKLAYYINHQKLIDKYSADVYISTYDTDKEDGFLSLQEVIDLYKPIKVNIEKLDDVKSKFEDISKNIVWRDYQINKQYRFVLNSNNTCSMFYKIQDCFDIIEDKYDVYIRMRFDNTFDTVTIESNDYLNVPLQASHSGICDQFAFGNYDNMKEYCHMFDKLYEYVNNNGEFHPETIVLNLNNKLEIIKQSMTFYLNGNLNVM